MKVLFNKIATCLLVAIAIVLVSCSNEGTYENQIPKETNVQVIKDLENVNAELLSTIPADTRSSKKWSKKDIINVVCADVEGALIGARIGSKIGTYIGLGLGSPLTGGVFGAGLGAIAGGSFKSWLSSPDEWFVKAPNDFDKIKDYCAEITDDQLNFRNNIASFTIVDSTAITNIDIAKQLIEKSKLDKKSLNIGRSHNTILSTMDGSITLKKKVPTATDNSKIKEAILNSKEFQDSCKIIAMKINSEELLSSDTILNKVMSLFNQILAEYPSKTDDVAFIIGKYVDVIDKTNDLTTEQKNCIKSGLATALYSSKYWESKFENR